MATKQIIKGVDNMVLAAGAIGVAGVGYYIYSRNKASAILPVEDQQAALPAATTTPKPATNTQVAVTLNKTLLLKNGSKGNEVKELQKLLGVTADGIFGPQTEAALYATKAVKQVTLAQYPTLTSVNKNALAVGNRIMANKKPSVGIYKAQALANNGYNLQATKLSDVAFGTEIGTIRYLSLYKTRYLISKPNSSAIYGWVEAAEVSKI